jgi:hypothetical protein
MYNVYYSNASGFCSCLLKVLNEDTILRKILKDAKISASEFEQLR